jgi:hypothetical protein
MLVDNEYQKCHPVGVGVAITIMILGLYHPVGVGVGITIMILGLYHPVGVGFGVRIIPRNIIPLQGWCLDWDFNSFYDFLPFRDFYRITYPIPKG